MFRSLRPIFTYVLCLLDVQLFVRKDLEGTGSILMHYWEIHNSNNSRACWIINHDVVVCCIMDDVCSD